MTEKTVKLSRAYEAHGKVFESVTIREPRFADLMELGEPYEVQSLKGGAPVVIENIEVVADYVRRCVTNPGTPSLGELGIRDARAVRDGVLGFFTRGVPPGEPSSAMSASEPTI